MAGLDNTMRGMNVLAGDEAAMLPDLPPEAQAIVAALGQIGGLPTADQVKEGMALAESMFGPLAQQLAQAPAPQAPSQASPFGQFATTLASNIAGTVNPAFADPGRQALNQQREDVLKFEQAGADKSRRGLELAAKMTEQGLKLAIEAQDDKQATNKAVQLARLNAILNKDKQSAGITQRGEEERKNIEARSRARVASTLKIRNEWKKVIDKSDLPESAKIRLRVHAGFLGTKLANEIRVDPITGESRMDPDAGLASAQQGFEEFLQEELAKAGVAAPADTAKKSDSLLDRVKARIGK